MSFHVICSLAWTKLHEKKLELNHYLLQALIDPALYIPLQARRILGSSGIW